MRVADDLAAMLTAGERAAFHGRPAAGFEPLQRAITAAEAAGLRTEAAGAGWLLGVCLGAAGRYGDALDRLAGLLEPNGDIAPEQEIFAALAAATVASLHRQLGKHAVARQYDERGMAWTTRTNGEGEAAFDCRLGLASDAVGLGDEATARAELGRAAALAEGHAEWWRQRVRLGWVEAEVELLAGDPERAIAAAHDAVELAERSGAPRHVAKGLLFLGIAQIEAGRLDEAIATLRRGALLAESLGTLPLQWPTRAVLGTLLADRDEAESERCLAAARRAAEAVSAGLPNGLRDEWRSRPDVSALLAG